jgi:hypothetical protein
MTEVGYDSDAMKNLVLGALLAAVSVSLRADDPIEVDFATLSGFDWVAGTALPESVTRYDEKTVKVSGFMQREDAGSGPTEYFMLINDACGCQGTPKLNEIVFCAMPPGQPTDIKPGIVTVTGKIYVGEESDDGVVVSLYTLDVDSLQ